MLSDQNEKIRSRAVEVIQNLRENEDQGNTSCRIYIKPNILFDAEQYPDMIDWNVEAVHEPITTTGLTKETLHTLTDTPLVVPPFPCHTQSVERLLKQVTRASAAVAGHNSRDGFIRVSAKSREKLPKFESKKDFVNNFA